MTAIPEDALTDAAYAYRSLQRAVYYADNLEEFRRDVELAQARLRGIALRMGWSK